MAHDGYARALYPAHTMGDGDTIFAVATAAQAGNADVSRIGALAAQVGQAEAVAHLAHQVAAVHLNQLFVLEEPERVADHLERQAQVLAQVATQHHPARVNGAEQQVAHERARQPRVLERLGRQRCLRRRAPVPVRGRPVPAQTHDQLQKGLRASDEG